LHQRRQRANGDFAKVGLAPLAAGTLVDAGWPTGNLYSVFALPLLIAIISVALIGRHSQAARSASRPAMP
jgi:hypothetical protein